MSSSTTTVPLPSTSSTGVSTFSLKVNGVVRSVSATPATPLLWVLRDLLGMTGTKFGCGIAQCGVCTVHLDGVPLRSCVLPVSEVGARAITTIEGIGATPVGQAIQRAWLDYEVIQCGYCQPGQIMSASALIAANQSPDDDAIDMAMAGNLCRCGTYVRIRKAIKAAASDFAANPQALAAGAVGNGVGPTTSMAGGDIAGDGTMGDSVANAAVSANAANADKQGARP